MRHNIVHDKQDDYTAAKTAQRRKVDEMEKERHRRPDVKEEDDKNKNSQ